MTKQLFLIICLTFTMQSYSLGLFDAARDAVSGAVDIAEDAVVTTGDIAQDVLDPLDYERRGIVLDDGSYEYQEEPVIIPEEPMEMREHPVKRVTEVTKTTEYLD
jgi:hypothetical protein